MIASNPNSICEQATAYYYDYLCEEGKEFIPARMLAHIDKCRHCQAEVNRLKIVLAKGESTGPTNSAVITGLELHFTYIGSPVTCRTVRPFLPSLADPALEIGVPTPITVHLDKCQQCAEDQQTIRQLNLTHKQLCRLGQLFAEEATVDAVVCAKVRNVIPSIVVMVLSESNAEVLKHLCTCSDCRELLHQHRETIRTKLLRNQKAQQKFPCEIVLASDIFDYCFTYGIDPANDEYAKFRPAFASHASACPTCLTKMQDLHNTVYSITERPDSGIVTCFSIEEQISRGAEPEPSDLYADWPINVQVFDKSEPEPDVIAVPHKLKQRFSAMNLRRFRIPAAAAIILIAAGLFLFNIPVAKAVDLGQIYKALERIKNVCITTFYQRESKPVQERWISQTLDTMILKTETQWVLWDIKGKSQKARDLSTGLIETAELNEDMLAKVEETVKAPWGLLPFNNISSIPEDAKWQQVADENIETTVPNTQVYDLMWMKKALDGSIVYKKWRFYIDTETKLPKRVEWWEKHAKEKEYELRIVTNVAYPAIAEIGAVIRDGGF